MISHLSWKKIIKPLQPSKPFQGYIFNSIKQCNSFLSCIDPAIFLKPSKKNVIITGSHLKKSFKVFLLSL